jgi:hypothetical protein
MKIRVGYELIYEFSPRPAMPMGGLPSRGAGWPFEPEGVPAATPDGGS